MRQKGIGGKAFTAVPDCWGWCWERLGVYDERMWECGVCGYVSVCVYVAGGRLSQLSPQMLVPFAILLAAVPTVPVAYVVAFASGLSIADSMLLPW